MYEGRKTEAGNIFFKHVKNCKGPEFTVGRQLLASAQVKGRRIGWAGTLP